MAGNSRATTGGLVALVACLSGCFAYNATELGDIRPGDDVRVRLSAAQFDELEEHLPGQDRVVEGDVVEAGSESILLEVPVSTTSDGMRMRSLSQRFEIPASGIVEVEHRTLDRRRTWFVGSLAALVTGIVIYDQLNSDAGTGIKDGGPPPQESRGFLFRIPLGDE